MRKVLVFGTFDILHKGHEYFLSHAKREGEELFAIVARDETVERVKGMPPVNKENKRLEALKSLEVINDAFLGEKKDFLLSVKKVMPDIICLGYDQKFLVKELEEEIKNQNWNIEVKRIDAYYADRYKSSILRQTAKKSN